MADNFSRYADFLTYTKPKFMSTLVETARTSDRVTISFPTGEFKPEDIDEIVSLVRVAVIARKSKMTVLDAETISEEIKSSWWNANRERILKMIENNG